MTGSMREGFCSKHRGTATRDVNQLAFACLRIHDEPIVIAAVAVTPDDTYPAVVEPQMDCQTIVGPIRGLFRVVLSRRLRCIRINKRGTGSSSLGQHEIRRRAFRIDLPARSDTSRVVTHLPAFEVASWTSRTGIRCIAPKIVVKQRGHKTRFTQRRCRKHVCFTRRVESGVLHDPANVDECAPTRAEYREPTLLAVSQRYLFGASPLIGKNEPATFLIANSAVTIIKMDREVAPSEPVHQVNIVFVKLNTDIVRAIEQT